MWSRHHVSGPSQLLSKIGELGALSLSSYQNWVI